MQKKINKKIRIIFFSFGILEQGGGFEDFLIQTAPELKELDEIFDTAIVTSTPKLTERLQSLLTFYYFKKHDLKNIYRESKLDINKRLGKVPYLQASNLNELIEYLNMYDYVYVKNEVLELFIMKIIKRRLRSKVITGIHTPIHYPYTPSISSKIHNLIYSSLIYRWLISDALQIKVNTNDDKALVIQILRHDNVKVVPHAFSVNGHKQVSNISKVLRVLFVGRITEQKGIDILVNLVKLQIANGVFKNFTYRVAGSGESGLEKELTILDAKYVNFKYLGHIPHEKVSKLYDWTDITIVPSKYETLNKTAVETAIAGKIVVSSNIPGPRDVIDNLKTGYLIDLNVENFYSKLNELIYIKNNNPVKLNEMGMKAQNKIEKDFNPRKIYSEFYNQLLNEH